ncbi:hypothetical protein D0A34_15395 [Microcoleus vaginatus PCC 9802]|nr:hypothetical protein D0A34_15395 [Microcoleus vaginatus PCC 9802]
MAVGAFEGELKEEGRRKKEEGRRKKEEGRRKREEGRGKKRKEHLFSISNFQFPITITIRKHIFQRRANSEKNASNQCNHRSGQRVRAAKLLQGAIA